MRSYYLALTLHLLGATIWTGGHLVLALGVLPRALREQRAEIVTEFESGYEKLGIPALVVQVGSGLWLADRVLGSTGWFSSDPIARVVQVKLALLAATVVLAVHTRLRLVPHATERNLRRLALHIRLVTGLAVVLVLAGASIRVGGYPMFDR